MVILATIWLTLEVLYIIQLSFKECHEKYTRFGFILGRLVTGVCWWIVIDYILTLI